MIFWNQVLGVVQVLQGLNTIVIVSEARDLPGGRKQQVFRLHLRMTIRK